MFSRQSLREFRYSHARRHAFKTPDIIRSALAHELFGLPLTASCAYAGERAPEEGFCFVLFAPKTSLTVKVNFVGLLCRVFTHTLGRFALFLSNSIERKFEMKQIAYRTRALSVLVQDVIYRDRSRGFQIR